MKKVNSEAKETTDTETNSGKKEAAETKPYSETKETAGTKADSEAQLNAKGQAESKEQAQENENINFPDSGEIRILKARDEIPCPEGASIVISGTAGKSGAGIIASGYLSGRIEKHSEKAERKSCLPEITGEGVFIPDELVQKALNPNIKITSDELRAAEDENVIAAVSAGAGGVFNALWRLGELLHTGLSVYLDRIDTDQDTIEICEIYRINPYLLFSRGVVIYVTENPARLLRELSGSGKHVSAAGYTLASKERVVIRRGEKQYLFPDPEDELLKIRMPGCRAF